MGKFFININSHSLRSYYQSVIYSLNSKKGRIMIRMRIFRVIFRLFFSLYYILTIFFNIYRTRGTAAPISLKTIIVQKIFGYNRNAYWPVHHSSVVVNASNILIGKGTAPGLSPGCYIQGIGKIQIGDYSIIGFNVGIISANHDLTDYRKHSIGSIKIGNYCWIGMNSVILSNVTLGDHTIVAAGSIVTKSYPEGYLVIAGNPAKPIKLIEREHCENYSNKFIYYGYIPEKYFD